MYNNFRYIILITGLLTASLCLSACTEESSPGPDEEYRSYYLGFTSLPYDTGMTAINYSFAKISSEADLFAIHFDDGVPWDEALNNKPYDPDMMYYWDVLKENIPAGHKVYLAVTPIDINREKLAPYRGAEGDTPLDSPWNTYAFNHPNVKQAYLNYVKTAVDYFDPDYLNIAVEANGLMNLSPGYWSDFMELHKETYTEIKRLYPGIPVMTSFIAMDLLEGYTGVERTAQLQTLQDMQNYTDYFGLSMHTFLSATMTDTIPDEIFEKLFTMSDKKFAVCETSYPAESFSVNAGELNFNSSPQKQLKFFTKMFTYADKYKPEFIINFVIRDYDDLWRLMGSPDDINILWRDTGFYDENGNPRPVRDLWLKKLAISVK